MLTELVEVENSQFQSRSLANIDPNFYCRIPFIFIGFFFDPSHFINIPENISCLLDVEGLQSIEKNNFFSSSFKFVRFSFCRRLETSDRIFLRHAQEQTTAH